VDARRIALISFATAVGLALAGCVIGGGVGLVAPGAVRSTFGVADGSPFNPARVGLGVGAVVGFLAGTAIAAVGIVVATGPGLLRWRPFSRGSLQPTLSGLVLAIALVAIGLASLMNPSQTAAEVWFGLTALALAWATLCAAIGLRRSRGFAAGFAIFGWSYLLLSLYPESRAQLPTTRLLAILEQRISGSWRMGVELLSLETGPFPARRRGAYWEPVVTSRGGIPGSLEIDVISPEFRRIGHSLATLLFAIAGGVAGEARLARRRAARPTTKST
jgi:hypothetical protein